MKSGWQTSTLGEVLAVLRNGVNCKQDRSGKGDKISRIESISQASFDLERVGYAQLTDRDKQQYRLYKGDILFSHINSAVHVGKTAVFDSSEPVYHGVNLLLMRPNDKVSSAYLDYALKFLFQTGYWRSVCKQSVNQSSVNQQDISRVQFRYPKAISEQQRIVGILDEAFEGITTGKANAEKNLQNARAIFESYLQSVFTQRGEGWVEKPLGKLATFRNGINFTRSSRGESVKIVGVKDFKQKFWAPLDELDTVSTEGMLQDSDTLKDNDILFVRSNGNMELIGRCLLVGEVPDRITHSGFTIRARLNSNIVSAKYLCHFLKSNDTRRKMIDSGIGTNIKSLNQSILSELVVPFPSITEQTHISDKLEAIDAETKHLESTYQQKLAALEELKKSLLHQAFNGEL